MHYLVLLHGDETAGARPGTPEWDADMAGYVAFGELAEHAIRGGAALHLTERARTIRHDGATVTVTDGPFAETTEALGGYYVLEAEHLDEVIELVRHLPSTAEGASEIRPMVLDELLRPEGEALPDLWLATLHRLEDDVERPGSPGWDEGAAEHGRFVQAHRERLVRIAALHPTTSATTVRVRDGRVTVTDGPASPAVAVVGGLYLLQGTSAEALALAREIPVGDDGAVELRPVMDLADMADPGGDTGDTGDPGGTGGPVG